MAHEGLMRQLPKGVERVAERGPFFIRKNSGGTHSIIVLTEVLVTCGGKDSKDRATDIACSLNRVWGEKIGKPTPGRST